ncbi:MAG: AlpA family phage regulatory protein [Burkholderiales bacterium]|nr:AlpA family phage regulatory protein [Burkholderiales bacterium]
MIQVEPLLVDLDTAASILAVSTSTFQELVRLGDAPKPRQISRRRVGWRLSELREWADNRPISDVLPPANTGARKPRRAASLGAADDTPDFGMAPGM